MNEKFNIMIVEDEKIAGKVICDNLIQKGFDVSLFENAEEALLNFQENQFDLILLDYRLPGMNGEEFFIKIKEMNPLTPVIFMTAYSSVESAVKLLKMGAYSYLIKPIEIEELNHNINNVLEKITLIKENIKLQENLRKKFSYNNYVFNSEKMQQILNIASRSADSSANILITGESGTGKEVIANIIHFYSKRKNNKFVKVNLSAIPETLIEAEVFGAIKGAYTGCFQTRIGKFEEADKGTIFLDEIGELPLDIQIKLLRVIQERELTKLGSNTPVKISIRLITASNKDLEKLVKEKKFRKDLFFRLNVINIKMPLLRERKEDIPLLIDLFIKKFNEREGKNIRKISKDALHSLMKYNFPGNIRELENIIERGIILARGDILTLLDLPVFINNQNEKNFDYIVNDNSLPLIERLHIIEKNIILNTLKNNNFNQTKTAIELGISESGLRYKLKSLKIKSKK